MNIVSSQEEVCSLVIKYHNVIITYLLLSTREKVSLIILIRVNNCIVNNHLAVPLTAESTARRFFTVMDHLRQMKDKVKHQGSTLV